MSNGEFVPDPTQPKWKQKIAERLWKDSQTKAYAKPEQAVATEDYSQFMDSVPDLSDNTVSSKAQSATDDKIDAIINGLSFKTAYMKYIRKMTPNESIHSGGKDEVMISCPWPGHEDKKPTASYNIKKKTFHCHGTCEKGGDILDLAAIHHGMVGDYKNGAKFHELRRKIGEDFGLKFHKDHSGRMVATTPEEEASIKKGLEENEEDLKAAIKKSKAPAAKEADTGVAEVISITRATDDVASNSPLPMFDWEKVVAPNTAIDAYMQACRINAVPEEFHFFNAMMLVGLAAGRNTCGPKKDQFYGNISPILVGNSGVGKSLSWKPVFTVLRDAMPFDVTPGAASPIVRGATVAHGPGSGEDLYDVFSKYKDPATGKFVENIRGVRAVITYGEVSHFMSKAQNKGSVLESSIQNLYDSMFETGLRSRSGGETKAREPFMCLMSTSQPRVIGKTFTSDQVANGLAGRLDFVTGTYKEPDPFSNEVGNLYEAVEKYQQIREWAESEPRHLEWSDDAALLWSDYFSEKIRPIKRNDDESTDILKRMDLKIKKFALIFAINEMHEEIERSDLEKAISMHDYIEEVLRFISGTIGKSKHNEMSEKVFEFILDFYKKNSKPATMRDIKRWGKPKFKEWEDADYVNTLKLLEQLGEIVTEEHRPKRGPATYTYQPHAEMVR